MAFSSVSGTHYLECPVCSRVLGPNPMGMNSLGQTPFGMWLRVWFTENFHELDLVSRLPSDKLKGLREQDSGREKARPHDLLTIIKLVSS